MSEREILDVITKLSHEFGTAKYVKAGGGNTSCKDAETLWIKPSGTTLAGLTPKKFVAMDRALLSQLYAARTPKSASEQEEMAKNMMAAAVKPETPGRASVEAPLHDSLEARYVVHTHPAEVNGLTCAVGGRAAAAKLFPDALWVPYVNPGYTLCMAVRKALKDYKALHGKHPSVILLENHGVFVSGDTLKEVKATYASLMAVLCMAYKDAGIDARDVKPKGAPSETEAAKWRGHLSRGLGAEASSVAVSGKFEVGCGPISPDHIVYAKSYAFEGIITPDNLAAFKKLRGYAPRVIVTGNAVLGVGTCAKVASLALELALDGAVVRHLAKAFGGIKYLSDSDRNFIENWEVETYRAKQV